MDCGNIAGKSAWVAIARRFGELLDRDPATAPLPAILAAQGRLGHELEMAEVPAAALANSLGGSIEAARAARPAGRLLDGLADLAIEALFVTPSRDLAARMAASGARFRYRFDTAPTARWRACHCIDLPFAFGDYRTWREGPMLGAMEGATFERPSAPVRGAITRFVREGEPGWPKDAEHVLGKQVACP